MLHLHDLEALRAALAMVQHYGPYALKRALVQIDELRSAGDVIGATTWALIADNIIELIREGNMTTPELTARPVISMPPLIVSPAAAPRPPH